MLMVVLGAGASYDSVPFLTGNPGYRERPPLADELFQDRPDFLNVMQRFPVCQAIIPLVQMPASGGTVEQVLEHLQSESDEYPERHKQLAAIRYYLHVMLWECEQRWRGIGRGISNYKTLLDQIERWREPDEQVCLVTFNYDRMIEDALPVVGVNIHDLSDYVGSKTYKLIKLHGSVNWGRLVHTHVLSIRDKNVWDVAYEMIDRIQELNITDTFRIVNELPMARSERDPDFALFPAIAIPVQTKQHFECPKEHVDALREFIPQTGKLLMIGWRAMEGHFLKLLADGLDHRLRVMAVSGSLDYAKQSVANLRNSGIDADAIESTGGFTNFIITREGDEFLRA